jgi:small subunit ribosomal protein S18
MPLSPSTLKDFKIALENSLFPIPYPLSPKFMAYFRKRLSPIKPGEPIDYKDVDLLRKFVTERGKILPRRITGLTSKQQRDMTLSIKRSRQIALMPFINVEG